MITLHEHMTAFVNKIERDGADVDYKKLARSWERMCFLEDREHRATKAKLRAGRKELKVLQEAVREFMRLYKMPCREWLGEDGMGLDAFSKALEDADQRASTLANYNGKAHGPDRESTNGR